jgi:uncharacterized protein (TIGR02001 family)
MTKKVTLGSKATSKTIRRSLAALLIAGSSFGVNAATLSGNVAFTSDYLFRGISQTDEGPAVQGGFTLSGESGFYVSAWGSNIKFGEGSMELDILGGWAGALNESWNVDVGVMQYRYPKGDNDVDEFNFFEGYAKFFYDSWTLGVAYSPDYFGTDVNDYYYLSADYKYQLVENFAIDLHLGYNVFEDSEEFATFLAAGPVSKDTYLDWSVGFSTEVWGAGVSLKYADTDIEGSAECDLCDGRAVLTLSKSF